MIDAIIMFAGCAEGETVSASNSNEEVRGDVALDGPLREKHIRANMVFTNVLSMAC